MPDPLSRPFAAPKPVRFQLSVEDQDANLGDPEYVPPDATTAALEEVALIVVNPQAIAEAQKLCNDVKTHRQGLKPTGVSMADVNVSGSILYCEVSDPKNPRPLLPAERSLVLNLIHHQDHPSAKETLRRTSHDYY